MTMHLDNFFLIRNEGAGKGVSVETTEILLDLPLWNTPICR